MKAPTYILKRVYLERNSEREYKNHQQRLERIKSQPSKFFIQVKKVNQQLDKAIKNHVRAIQHKEEEKNREEKVTNKALINKLLEINDGRTRFAPLLLHSCHRVAVVPPSHVRTQIHPHLRARYQ